MIISKNVILKLILLLTLIILLTPKTYASSSDEEKYKYLAQDIEHVSKKIPAWTLIQNKEIKISSSEIRNQRNKLRGKY